MGGGLWGLEGYFLNHLAMGSLLAASALFPWLEGRGTWIGVWEGFF